jgi:hypothetical protein
LQRALQRRLRRGQRPESERTPAGLEEEGGGAVTVARLVGQLGGQIAPVVLELRVCRFDGAQGRPGEEGALARQQLAEDGVAGESVPEPERAGPRCSQTRSCAVVARPSATTISCSLNSVMLERSVQSNRLPSTAAAPSAARAVGPREPRRSTTVATKVRGAAGSNPGSTLHP